MVGPEAEKEGGIRIVLFEQFKQARNTFACSAQGIDIDLEGEGFALWMRHAANYIRNPPDES
jgi:hypothetical protein